jgi:hypothetical protein
MECSMSILHVLIVAAASQSASLPGQTIEWEQIWDQPDTATIYVDRASITGSGDFRSISTRAVYRGNLPKGYIAERVRTEEFDCKRHQSRIRHVRILAADSRAPEVIDWSPAEVEWSPDEPGSLGALKLEIACGISADALK